MNGTPSRRNDLSAPRAALFLLFAGLLNPGILPWLTTFRFGPETGFVIAMIALLYTLPCLVAAQVARRSLAWGAGPFEAILSGFRFAALLGLCLALLVAFAGPLLFGAGPGVFSAAQFVTLLAGLLFYILTVALPAAACAWLILHLLLPRDA